MSDKPGNPPAADRRLPLDQSGDAHDWARQLGVDEEVLRFAVKSVGPDLHAVRSFLGIG